MVDRLGQCAGSRGVVWLDGLGRDLLRDGTLRRLVASRQVGGAATGPLSYGWAVVATHRHDAEMAQLAAAGVAVEDALCSLAACTARWACDVLGPVHERTGGADGQVSLAIDPRHAFDTGRLVAEARTQRRLVDRPNLVIEIPATTQGMRAMSACLAEGIGVRATLIFSVECCAAVQEALVTGLEQAVAAGRDARRLACFACLPVMVLDRVVDARLDRLADPRARRLRGEVGIATGKRAHQHAREFLAAARWRALETAGVRPPRLQWALDPDARQGSVRETTGYLDHLGMPDTVALMSETALRAAATHRSPPGQQVRTGHESADDVLAELSAIGIDLHRAAQAALHKALTASLVGWADLGCVVGAALDGGVALGPTGSRANGRP